MVKKNYMIRSLVLLLIIPSFGLFAQKSIKVSEQTKSFSTGGQNALVVNIYEADEDLIVKEYKKLMKDFGAKVSSKKEIFADDASIKSLSDNTIDVYALVEKNSDTEYNLIVGFDLGGAYLSSKMHSDKYKSAEKLLKDFAIATSKEAINEQLKVEEKFLSKLNKELEGLVKDNESLHKDIEDYKKKIKEAESSIETNTKNQELKKKELENQNSLIKTISDKKSSIK